MKAECKQCGVNYEVPEIDETHEQFTQQAGYCSTDCVILKLNDWIKRLNDLKEKTK